VLPSPGTFEEFIDSLQKQTAVSINVTDTGTKIKEGSFFSIGKTGEGYSFSLRRNILFTPQNFPREYKSKKFEEEFPGMEYRGEKYLITASSREINIYNLYTNMLTASYTAGFTLGNKEVIAEKGFFKFMVKNEVFDENPESLSISGY
jgi:hypothetical protein